MCAIAHRADGAHCACDDCLIDHRFDCVYASGMRNVITSITLGLCLVALGCKDTADEGDATSAVETAGSCTPLSPCGGDVTGAWEITTGCFNFMTVSGGPLIPSCPAATMEYVPDSSVGSYVFESGGRYNMQFELVGRLVTVLPTSCLRTGATCATFENVAEGRSCVRSGQSCRCEEPLEIGDPRTQSGSFSARGSLIEFSNDVAMNYCVKGKQLTLESVSEVEMGDTIDGRMQLVLRKK